MSVIDMQAEKEKREPYMTGAAHCLNCQHSWAADAPIGTIWLACPSCTLVRGRFTLPVVRQNGDAHWHCKCGNDLFYSVADGIYCPNCGEWQHGF